MANRPVRQYQYRWQAKNAGGQIVKGVISASSLPMAKIQLRKQGINPSKIKKYTEPFWRHKKILTSDITLFSRQLATILKSGVPLIQGFYIIQTGLKHNALQKLLMDLKTTIEQGHSLSDALRQYPEYFDPLYCNLVEIGELSGSLGEMMDRIASHKERIEFLKKKIKKALYYPIAIVTVAILVMTIMLLFVIPQFETMFESFDAKLPAFTLMLIHFSLFVRSDWWLIFGVVGLSVWLFCYQRKRSSGFIAYTDNLILRLPVFGPIIKKTIVARFARTLSTTFAAGVPLIDSLIAVAGATGNVVYKNAVLKIKIDIEAGTALYSAMSQAMVFPPMVVQMVAIGEESGSLDSMLAKAASVFEDDVSTTVDGLSSLLEPIIMLVIGIMVAALVIAMYLPIFKMGSVL